MGVKLVSFDATWHTYKEAYMFTWWLVSAFQELEPSEAKSVPSVAKPCHVQYTYQVVLINALLLKVVSA